MIDDLLREAITAIKSGDKARGKQLLVQVLEQNSRNEYAWLWLSQCVTSHEQKLDCIKRVLDINPNNTTAQKELARLQTLSQIKAQPVQPVLSTPPQKKAKSTNSFLWIFVAVIAMGCFCVFALGVLWNSGSGNGGVNTSGGSTNEGDTNAWVPSGFEKWNNEIAYRFVKGKSCTLDIAEACVHYEIYTRYGCPNSLYVEVAFLDTSGAQVDWSNNTTTSLSPGSRALLEFVSFESSAKQVHITQIICY
jgi:hypothetical protein